MPSETIGYTPESVTKPVVSAEMPTSRNPEANAEKDVRFVQLNPFDQQLSQMPEELLDAIAVNMALKDISAESFKS